MTDLSPQAQAIVDAYENTTDKYDALAAVLRAAADQVVPKDADPVWDTNVDWAKWRALDDVRDKLLSIVKELENV